MKIILSLFSGTALRVLTVAALAVAVLAPQEAGAVNCTHPSAYQASPTAIFSGWCPCPIICANKEFDGNEEHQAATYSWACVTDSETCPYPCAPGLGRQPFWFVCCDEEYCGPNACCFIDLPGPPIVCQECPMRAVLMIKDTKILSLTSFEEFGNV